MRFSLNGLKQPLNRKRSRQYEWRNPICGSMLSLNVFNVYTITLLMLITTTPKLNGSKQWLLFLTILWGFLCGSSVNITGLTQVATVRWGGGWSSYMDSSLQGLSCYGWNDWDGPPGFSSWVSWHMEEALPKHKHEIGFLEANTQSHSHSIFLGQSTSQGQSGFKRRKSCKEFVVVVIFNLSLYMYVSAQL